MDDNQKDFILGILSNAVRLLMPKEATPPGCYPGMVIKVPDSLKKETGYPNNYVVVHYNADTEEVVTTPVLPEEEEVLKTENKKEDLDGLFVLSADENSTV